MSDYIMFLFGEHKEQDKFIESIANEVSVIANSKNIKFYYGQSSAIFTFSSVETFDDIKEFLGIIFSGSNIVHVLVPYNHDKLSVSLPKGIYEHLFDIDNSETMSGLKIEAQESINDVDDRISEFEFIKLVNEEDEFDDDFELTNLKTKKKEPTIDDILDKISEKGLSSLTDIEKQILEKYSKTI